MSLFSRRRAVLVAMAITLVLGTAVSGTALAGGIVSPGQETKQAAPLADGNDLNSRLRQMLFPQLPAGKCLTGEVTRRTGWTAPIPCNPEFSMKGVPAQVPADFVTMPGTEFAKVVAIRAGVPMSVASAEVARVAGIPVSQVGVLTAGEVGHKIYSMVGYGAASSAVSGSAATGPSTMAWNTRVCVNNPPGPRQCAALDPEHDGWLIGGVVGGVVGGLICGICAAIGAVIGAIIGYFTD
jgi:hypothetical protein